MKSFFHKVTSDAVSFKEKNKKYKSKPQPNFSAPQNEGIPTNGSNIRIENCPNFHFGNTITLITTNVINKEEQVLSPEKKGHDSAQVIPKKVKENFSNISQATIEHFELISSKINDFKYLEKKLGFIEDQLYSSTDGIQMELLVCQMLYSWKKAKTREATVGLLLKILWEAKEYDAAIYMSDNI
ncbi:unnamed protein product [Nezara viridula]|uniref:Death domain-containing protein n=1 Tax=Nezara viridula TaxID=85310 RepID=A0A9P0ECS1_NEZVI|nr:unnamed protein product [Nezara viridula]